MKSPIQIRRGDAVQDIRELAALTSRPIADAVAEAVARGWRRHDPVNHWQVQVRFKSVRGPATRKYADKILDDLGVVVRDITAEQRRIAVQAHQEFGRRTPAKLNLGDCFAYALAVSEGDGLLFKGEDFPKTDVRSALA